jgi:hypothetical protein
MVNPINSANASLGIAIHNCLRLLMPYLRIVETRKRSKLKMINPQMIAKPIVQNQLPNTVYTA